MSPLSPILKYIVEYFDGYGACEGVAVMFRIVLIDHKE